MHISRVGKKKRMRSDPRRVGVSERRSLPCSSLITGCRGKGSTRLQALAKLEKFEWYYEASSKQYQGNIATKAFDDECVLSKDSEVHGLTRKGCSRSSSHGCLPVFDLYYVHIRNSEIRQICIVYKEYKFKYVVRSQWLLKHTFTLPQSTVRQTYVDPAISYPSLRWLMADVLYLASQSRR